MLGRETRKLGDGFRSALGVLSRNGSHVCLIIFISQEVLNRWQTVATFT